MQRHKKLQPQNTTTAPMGANEVKMNKATKIVLITVASILLAAIITLTTWSCIVDMSPIALAKSWFVKSAPVTYTGTNLFNKNDATQTADGGYVYAPISLKADTTYIVTAHADSLEGFDFEGAMNYLLFSNSVLDLKELGMEEIISSKTIEAVMFLTLPPSFKFSTKLYDYRYLTVISSADYAAADFGVKLKIEENIVPTIYTDFGKGSTLAYDWRTLITEEPAEPTAIAAGDTIEHLYLNTSSEGSAILQAITTFSEATAIILYPADDELKTAGHYANLIFAGVDDFRMLALVQGPDSEQVITLLWCSADGFDLTQLGLTGTSVAGWQDAAQGDLATTYGFAGYVIQAIDGDTIKYTEWANGGDAVAGKTTVDSLFSSTPWA